jgi:small redox-active disulfide protein 2
MNIKILGPGCSKCHTLNKNVRIAVEELSLAADIEKVEDIMEIMKYDVINTPGLILDGKLVSSGRILTVKQLKDILTKNH